MRWHSGVGGDNVLMDFDSAKASGNLTPLYHALRDQALDFGAQFIVIDTAADTFGGNENARTDVRRFIGLLNRLAVEVNGAVFLCAHPSVAGMQNGSGYGGNTAWNNSVRSRLYLSAPTGEDDPDMRLFSRKKANYAAREESMRLRWRDGVFETLDDPQSTTGVAGAIVRDQKQRQAQECFLRALDDMNAQGRNLSISKNAGNYAPKEMHTLTYCKAFTTKDIENAMHTLFEQGVIINENYGRKGKIASRLIKVNETKKECHGVL